MFEKLRKPNRTMKSFVLLLAIALVSSTFLPYAKSSQAQAQSIEDIQFPGAGDRQGEYMENPLDPDDTFDFELELSEFYHEQMEIWEAEGVPNGTEEVYIPATDMIDQSDDAEIEFGSYHGEDDVLIWRNQRGWVEFEVDVAQEGLYQLELEYFPIPLDEGGGRGSVILGAVVNGESQYRESSALAFHREWEDQWLEDGELRVDEYGDQIRPSIQEIERWKRAPFRDMEGAYVMPLTWHLEQGTNTIRLELDQESFAMKGIHLVPPVEVQSYEEVYAQYPGNMPNTDPIEIRAQQMDVKNDTAIQVQFDRDGFVTPASFDTIVYNTVGGWRWFRGGQAATWQFDVPESGHYKLGVRAKNDTRANLSVFRNIYINDEIPFEEFGSYQFQYDANWRGVEIADEEGIPYEIYLEEGENSITMENTYNPYIPVIVEIDHITTVLRSITIELRNITGGREDEWRVWDLEELGDIIEQLEGLYVQVNETAELMEEINGVRDDVSRSLASTARDIERLLRRPERIPRQQETVGSMQESVENQRQALLDQPLQLDQIYVVPADQDYPRMSANVLERVQSLLYTFIYSFVDRDQLDRVSDDELNVWMMWGRDYVDELNQLSSQYFEPEFEFPVRITLIHQPQMLILANAAGIMPDIAVGIPGELPYDMALRGATQNLSVLDGADEVFEQFHPGSLLPFWHDDGVEPGYYAIPENLQFKIMFYRKDIMNELGLGIPDTWDDVYEMLPTLLQNNYNFFMEPRDFSVIYYQRGVELYPEHGLTTGLDTPESFAAFRQWTDLFNVYGLDRYVQSFYNQFRRGYFPIGVADFNQYMQLLVAAPELRGFWGIAPIPGMENEDGEIERWSGGVPDLAGGAALGYTANIAGSAMNAVMLFTGTPPHLQDMAWDFAKWYMSEEIQTAFGLNLEQYYGEEFRWNSAHVGAFSNMPWHPDDLDVILYQWQWFKDFPNAPGSYMTGRELNFAWIRTVVEDINYRESLEEAILNINREMYRKQMEFGIIEDGIRVRDSVNIPQINEPWTGVDEYAR